MDTASFNRLYDELVGTPLTDLGGHQEGRAIFWNSANLSVAILRTELRYLPPPKLTLLVRHPAMRNMNSEIPPSPSKRPNDYMLKLLPSEAPSLLRDDFCYTPLNLGSYPKETFDWSNESEGRIRNGLTDLGQILSSVLPQLENRLTPAVLLRLLVEEGEDAWCERMWIEDLTEQNSNR